MYKRQVKDKLKEVIDYAENPDKTIDQKYMDKDLYAALQYVSNDKKTDKRMYVDVYKRQTQDLLKRGCAYG